MTYKFGIHNRQYQNYRRILTWLRNHQDGQQIYTTLRDCTVYPDCEEPVKIAFRSAKAIFEHLEVLGAIKLEHGMRFHNPDGSWRCARTRIIIVSREKLWEIMVYVLNGRHTPDKKITCIQTYWKNKTTDPRRNTPNGISAVRNRRRASLQDRQKRIGAVLSNAFTTRTGFYSNLRTYFTAFVRNWFVANGVKNIDVPPNLLLSRLDSANCGQLCLKTFGDLRAMVRAGYQDYPRTDEQMVAFALAANSAAGAA